MSAAPAWVSYVALLLSAASLLVAGLSYRAGGPRLRLESVRLRAAASPFPDGAPIRLTVINEGRAAVSVQSFLVTPYGDRSPAGTVDECEGPELPYRLEAHETQTWCVNALPAAHAYDAQRRSGRLKPNSTWPSVFRFSVAAGDGKTAHSRTTFDSLRIIADSRPQQP